jgi:hypothetical protein
MVDPTIQGNAPTRVQQNIDISTTLVDSAVIGGPVTGTVALSPADAKVVIDTVKKTSTAAVPAAPILEAPAIKDSAAVGQARSNIGAIAKEFFPPETVALLTSANNKIMDPTNTDPSVVAARESMTSIGTTMLAVVNASSEDSINQFVTTTLAKNGIDASSVNYKDLGSALAMVALFLSQMPSLAAKSTETQLKALQNKADTITAQIGQDMKEAQKAAAKAEKEAKESKKSSKTSEIFGWVAAGATLLAGIALVATGVGGPAGVGLLVIGGLMLGNQIMSATGVYDKVPALGKAMAYIMPIATAVVAIACAVPSGGSSLSLLMVGGAALTTLGSATQITDQALKDTEEIKEGGTADQVMTYTGVGLQVAGGVTMGAGALKGAGSAATAAGDAAEGAESPTSSLQTAGKATAGGAKFVSGASNVVAGALQIKSGELNKEVAGLKNQLTTVQAQIQELQTQSDVTQQIEGVVIKVFQQLTEQNADTSQTVMQTIATAGEGTMAIAASIGQTTTTA